MPDTGAPWNIPFLDGTELVRAYPDFSEDLADAVAAGLTAAGVVKQIVTAIPTAVFSTTSSTFVDVTGYTANITPTASDSTIVGLLGFRYSSSDTSNNAARILRDATVVSLGDDLAGLGNVFTATDSSANFMDTSFGFTDAPSSTSALTYKMQVRRSRGTLRIGERASGGNVRNGFLILVEVAA